MSHYYIKNQEFSKAINLINSSEKFKDSDVLYDRAIYELAREQYDKEEYDKAIKYIEMMNEPHELNANALAFDSYIKKASILISQKNYEDASKILNESILDYAKNLYSQELDTLRNILKMSYKKNN